ncbi:hypothetical protein [Shimazuella kribbensis]|uniref:hypothetical protein n=1 Tax=Shimazuella kribbensis TaxID=139808 RepID=UPI000414DBF0|nr:hypothetical protein [Shimazuella kribbensis]
MRKITKTLLATALLAGATIPVFTSIPDVNAAGGTQTFSYTKNATTKSFTATDKHISIYTHCKGGSTQKIYWQELKKGKWVTDKSASGTVSCSKSKEIETYGGAPSKKGHQYRFYFVNPGKSKIHMRVNVTFEANSPG